MENLLTNEKKENCRLDLPEGLKELMSDISREVLRAQPSDIYGFIASYLSAMLVTRDNLSIASQICSNVCECDCHPELYSELRGIGLDEANAQKAQNVIMKFLRNETVIEGNLIAALLAKTNIETRMFPAVINAVRTAYLRHQAHNSIRCETSSENVQDEFATAVSHTLNLYKQTSPTEESYGEMAQKIQASYRAYGVRRNCKSNTDNNQESDNPEPVYQSDFDEGTGTSHSSSFSDDVRSELEKATSMYLKRMNTVSSISLAGSYCTLPKHKPYSAHKVEYLSLLEETEKDTSRSHQTLVANEGRKPSTENKNKRISFVNESEEEIHNNEIHGAEATEEASEEVYNDDTSELEIPPDDNNEQVLRVDDNISTEDIEEYVFEEIVELDTRLGLEEYLKAGVSQIDINYINVMNKEVDTDSEDDYDG